MANLLSWFGDRLKDFENGIGGIVNAGERAIGSAFQPAPQPPQRPQPPRRPVAPAQRPQGPLAPPRAARPELDMNTMLQPPTPPKPAIPKPAPPPQPPQLHFDPVAGVNALAQAPAKFVGGVGDTLTNLARGTARAPETLLRSVADFGAKAIDSKANASQGEQNTGVRELLYGKEPIKTYQDQSKAVGAQLKADKKTAWLAPAAPFLAPVLALGDATAISGAAPAIKTAVKIGKDVAPLVSQATKESVAAAKAAPEAGFVRVGGESASAPLSSPEALNKYIREDGKVNAFQRLSPAYQDIVKSSRNETGLSVPSRTDLPSAPTGIPPPQLPTFGTKKVGAVDKTFRSTRSIIERQGPSGQQLGNALQGARDTQEIYLGQLEKAMPTVTQLARKGHNSFTNKDFENFVDATQGLAPPKSPVVAQAVQEWQAVHPTVRDRAVQAGLDVGDLGPNYYPHFIDYDKVFKDKNTYNEAINHLVKTGQAPTPEEAIKLLGYARDVSRNREFGNLEASRIVDLPFYDKTPNSLIGYLNGSTKRIAHTETFGAKDENALKLISNIGLEGGDTEAAKNAFDIAVGAKRYNQTGENISQGIRKYVTTTRLGLGALTNVSQNVNTGIVTGHLRTLGVMVKQLNPKNREFVADTGVISDALLNDLRTQYGYESFASKVLGKAVNKVTAPFFGSVEKFNRAVAATAGRDYALRLAQRGNERTLRRLGVTGPIEGKTLTEAQQIQAARKVVEKTQFKVDPQDLPGWTSSPGGKLVSQFRTFSYNQGKFFSNEILKPAAKGNVLPLSRLLAAIPLGYGLYQTRAAIDARSPEEDPTKLGLQAFSKVGGAGLALDIYQSLNPVGSKYLPSDRRVSMAAGAFGGPAVGLGTQAVGALSEAIQQKNVPKDETRLGGKVAVKSGDGKYTDLTPATRFGLQQLPIAGTAIANRVLPYKKESQSDVGGQQNTSSAIKAVNAASQDKLKSLQKSVGADTYAISNLSANEKKQLIDNGTITQEQADKAEETVKKKRIELGLDTKKSIKTFADKYKEAKKEFDTKSGEWSAVTKAKKSKDLRYLSVQKEFDNDTVDLYNMSKGDVYNLVSTDSDGKKKVENILKYGDALVDAGLAKTNKYRDKYGNTKLASTKSVVSKGGKKGGRGKAKGKSKGKKGSAINIGAVLKSSTKSRIPKTTHPPTSAGTGTIKAPTYKSTPIRMATFAKAPALPRGVKVKRGMA